MGCCGRFFGVWLGDNIGVPSTLGFVAFVVGATLGCVAVVTGATLGDFAVRLEFLAKIFVKMLLSF